MRFLEHVRLAASGKMGFDWTAPEDCNAYLLDGGGEFALIDAGAGASAGHILSVVREAGCGPGQLKFVFLTHLHADHAGGAHALREATGAKVALWSGGGPILARGDEAAIDLDRARAAGFYPPDFRFAPCEPDLLLEDGGSLPLGRLTIRVLHTPGHSGLDASFFVTNGSDHVSLFAGDTVFFGGRISLLHTHDFDQHALARSLDRLARERANSLFAGHLQPALSNAADHVARAVDCFGRLQVPPSIV